LLLPFFEKDFFQNLKTIIFNRYKGMELLMPFAKWVSAKSHDFDAEGNETI